MRRFGRRDAAPTFNEQIPRLDLAARRAIDSEAYSGRSERLCQRSGTLNHQWAAAIRFPGETSPKYVTMERFTRARQSAARPFRRARVR